MFRKYYYTTRFSQSNDLNEAGFLLVAPIRPIWNKSSPSLPRMVRQYRTRARRGLWSSFGKAGNKLQAPPPLAWCLTNILHALDLSIFASETFVDRRQRTTKNVERVTKACKIANVTATFFNLFTCAKYGGEGYREQLAVLSAREARRRQPSARMTRVGRHGRTRSCALSCEDPSLASVQSDSGPHSTAYLCDDLLFNSLPPEADL